MSSSAIAAARRLRDGGTLDACPHTTILELLQELELLAATPPETDLPHSAAAIAREGKECHMRPEERARLEAANGEASQADTGNTDENQAGSDQAAGNVASDTSSADAGSDAGADSAAN